MNLIRAGNTFADFIDERESYFIQVYLMRKWFSWKNIKRASKYWYWRVVRQSGTPESAAMGMAIGMFIGFIVPVGGQIILAVALAYLFKANKFLAILGTCNSNNFTIPVLYPLQCYVGGIVLGNPVSMHVIKGEITTFINNPSWQVLLELGEHILVPFFIGGAIFGIAAGLLSYYITLGLVTQYRKRKYADWNRRLADLATDKNP